jgi:hypothetical protein
MSYLLCRHIKTNGIQCQAPALTNAAHCYFHNRLYQRHSGFRHRPETPSYLVPGQHIELAPLEDRESIQVALSVVVNALATGQLETRRATAILYGLQLASNNSARLNLDPFAPNVVRAVDLSPEGLDLALPGATGDVSADWLTEDYDEDEEQEEAEE